jgi:hypothetical protein
MATSRDGDVRSRPALLPFRLQAAPCRDTRSGQIAGELGGSRGIRGGRAQ